MLSLKSLEPSATAEILARTRHPRYSGPGYPDAGPVRAWSPTADVGQALACWLGKDSDPESVTAWLAEHGYERGRRYEHNRCPLDEMTPSHGQPVYVGDAGIYCHKGMASGQSIGGRSRAFVPCRPWSRAAFPTGCEKPRAASAIGRMPSISWLKT